MERKIGLEVPTPIWTLSKNQICGAGCPKAIFETININININIAKWLFREPSLFHLWGNC